MEQDSRKVQRFAVQLPCTFSDSMEQHDGTILSLSPQGCAMTAERLPLVSSYISLLIKFLDGTHSVEIELAGVRWVSERRCGIEFIRMSPEMLMHLRTFVHTIETLP